MGRMISPAERTIAKFRSAQKVAEIAGVNVSNVHRWTYPKDRGGTGGLVPGRHHRRLLDAGRDPDIGLTPADLVEWVP